MKTSALFIKALENKGVKYILGIWQLCTAGINRPIGAFDVLEVSRSDVGHLKQSVY